MLIIIMPQKPNKEFQEDLMTLVVKEHSILS